METNAIKLKYNISPKAYADFLFAKDEENSQIVLKEFFQRLLNKEIGWKFHPYTPFFYVSKGNTLFLFNSERALGQNECNECKDYIKICTLPLGFFDDVAKSFDYPFALRSDYSAKVNVLIGEYFKFVVKNLLQQIPSCALKIPLSGSVNLNLQVITYNEFKNTRHYKRGKKEHAFGEIFRVARKMFRAEDFFLEVSAGQGSNQILLWDCRSKKSLTYEVLSYTSDNFDFLDGKDKRLQKLFIRMYFEHLLQVNLKQILGGLNEK